MDQNPYESPQEADPLTTGKIVKRGLGVPMVVNAIEPGVLHAFATLCGVPPESLLYSDDELKIMRRRVERFKRLLNISQPKKKKAA